MERCMAFVNCPEKMFANVTLITSSTNFLFEKKFTDNEFFRFCWEI